MQGGTPHLRLWLLPLDAHDATLPAASLSCDHLPPLPAALPPLLPSRFTSATLIPACTAPLLLPSSDPYEAIREALGKARRQELFSFAAAQLLVMGTPERAALMLKCVGGGLGWWRLRRQAGTGVASVGGHMQQAAVGCGNAGAPCRAAGVWAGKHSGWAAQTAAGCRWLCCRWLGCGVGAGAAAVPSHASDSHINPSPCHDRSQDTGARLNFVIAALRPYFLELQAKASLKRGLE